MNKRNFAICVIALLSGASLFAQGKSPTGFGTPNNLYKFYPSIAKTNSKGTFSACYWVLLGPARSLVQYPIVGMPVVASSYTTCGSGGHSHDQSCAADRPQMALGINADLADTVHGVTDETGCFNYVGLFPGYAGYVTTEAINAEFSTVILTPEAVFVIHLTPTPLGQNVLLQDYGPDGTPPLSNDPVNPVPYEEYSYDSSLNNTAYEPQDYQHGNAINNALPTTIQQTKLASEDYMKGAYDYVGYEDKIIIWRMSLPEGGLADNAVSNSITSMQYPNWDQTTPYNAGNVFGVEVEITNPSMAPYADPDGGIQDDQAAMYAIWVFKERGCTMGQFQPSFDETTADAPLIGGSAEIFWVHQTRIHFECAPGFRRLDGR